MGLHVFEAVSEQVALAIAGPGESRGSAAYGTLAGHGARVSGGHGAGCDLDGFGQLGVPVLDIHSAGVVHHAWPSDHGAATVAAAIHKVIPVAGPRGGHSVAGIDFVVWGGTQQSFLSFLC